jgi:hypothetical protein
MLVQDEVVAQAEASMRCIKNRDHPFGGRAAFILQKFLGRTYNFRLEALRSLRRAQNLLRRVRIGLQALALRHKPKIGELLALLHQS